MIAKRKYTKFFVLLLIFSICIAQVYTQKTDASSTFKLTEVESIHKKQEYKLTHFRNPELQEEIRYEI